MTAFCAHTGHTYLFLCVSPKEHVKSIKWQLWKPDSHRPSSWFYAAAVSDFSGPPAARLHALLCAATQVFIINEWADFLKCFKPPAFVRCCVWGHAFNVPVGSYISDIGFTSACTGLRGQPAVRDQGLRPPFLDTQPSVEIALDPTPCQSFADSYGHPSGLPCKCFVLALVSANCQNCLTKLRGEAIMLDKNRENSSSERPEARVKSSGWGFGGTASLSGPLQGCRRQCFMIPAASRLTFRLPRSWGRGQK